MAERSRENPDDNQSSRKTAKHPEKSPEKCVSRVRLCDLREVQRKQNAFHKDCLTHQQHKCMTNNCNPELSESCRWCKYPRSTTSQNQLCPTRAGERPSSLSRRCTLQHTLQPLIMFSRNSRLVQLKIFSSGAQLMVTVQISYLTPQSPGLVNERIFA